MPATSGHPMAPRIARPSRAQGARHAEAKMMPRPASLPMAPRIARPLQAQGARRAGAKTVPATSGLLVAPRIVRASQAQDARRTEAKDRARDLRPPGGAAHCAGPPLPGPGRFASLRDRYATLDLRASAAPTAGSAGRPGPAPLARGATRRRSARKLGSACVIKGKWVLRKII